MNKGIEMVNCEDHDYNYSNNSNKSNNSAFFIIITCIMLIISYIYIDRKHILIISLLIGIIVFLFFTTVRQYALILVQRNLIVKNEADKELKELFEKINNK